MKNIEVEIQVIVKNPEKAEAKLNEVGKFVKSRKQVDKYFVPPYRDFFAKDMPDEYLRVRYEEDKNHLNYSFLHFSEDGWLRSTDEYETLVDKPEVAEEIFKKIGLILKITVKKTAPWSLPGVLNKVPRGTMALLHKAILSLQECLLQNSLKMSLRGM